MIEGYFPGPGGRMAGPPAERPGPERTDPVGQAPAEVVALAARCAWLEAVTEAAAELADLAARATCEPRRFYENAGGLQQRLRRATAATRAALSAAGAATDQGDGT